MFRLMVPTACGLAVPALVMGTQAEPNSASPSPSTLKQKAFDFMRRSGYADGMKSEMYTEDCITEAIENVQKYAGKLQASPVLNNTTLLETHNCIIPNSRKGRKVNFTMNSVPATNTNNIPLSDQTLQLAQELIAGNIQGALDIWAPWDKTSFSELCSDKQRGGNYLSELGHSLGFNHSKMHHTQIYPFNKLLICH